MLAHRQSIIIQFYHLRKSVNRIRDDELLISREFLRAHFILNHMTNVTI